MNTFIYEVGAMMIYIRIVRGSVVCIAASGLIYGALLGAAYGTLFVPILGTVFGAFTGAVIGLPLGFAEGVILGVITARYYFPLVDETIYRRVISVIGSLVGFVGAVVGFPLLLGTSGPIEERIAEMLSNDASVFYYLIPVLIATAAAGWASRKFGNRYLHTKFDEKKIEKRQSAIYEGAFVRALFDELQRTYDRVNTLTSFGFDRRWRRQLVDLLPIRPRMRVGDLMSGGGEIWPYLLPRIGQEGRILAVDFSRAMVEEARRRHRRSRIENVLVFEEDVLSNSIPDENLDMVVCAFGVKTLPPVAREHFAQEVARILRPGGGFGIIEVSVPGFPPLRALYMFYILRIVPLIGRMLLGNPENYRMLGRYMLQFGNCHPLAEVFQEHGFAVCYKALFWGCASALVGVKRTPDDTGKEILSSDHEAW